MASKRKAQKQTQVQKEYRKERNRIQRQINRMHKRGYYGMEEMLPAKPKKVTKASVRRLKRITTKDLYDKADFIDLTTGEVLGTGEQGRAIERKRSAVKAQETRRARRKQRQAEAQQQAESQKTFEEEIQEAIKRDRERKEEEWRARREARDAENRERMERDEQFRQQFTDGEIILRRVEEMLQESRWRHPNRVAQVQQLLQYAIATARHGREEVAARLEGHAEIINLLEAYFDSDGKQVIAGTTAWADIQSAILDRPLSAQEMRDIEDAGEKDDSFDVDEEP